MTNVNTFLNSNDFNSLIKKDKLTFILMDATYNQITEWKPLGAYFMPWFYNIYVYK